MYLKVHGYGARLCVQKRYLTAAKARQPWASDTCTPPHAPDSNIAFGIYRYPYDASLRHRQFNPLYVRDRFLNTLSESLATGARRALGGDQGKREVRRKVLMREMQVHFCFDICHYAVHVDICYYDIDICHFVDTCHYAFRADICHYDARDAGPFA